MRQDRIKIIMYRSHLAYIDPVLMAAFDHHCAVVNFSAWIRQQAQQDFGLVITNKEDLLALDEAVTEHYYSDKTEWLREKMRSAIHSSKQQD